MINKKHNNEVFRYMWLTNKKLVMCDSFALVEIDAEVYFNCEVPCGDFCIPHDAFSDNFRIFSFDGNNIIVNGKSFEMRTDIKIPNYSIIIPERSNVNVNHVGINPEILLNASKAVNKYSSGVKIIASDNNKAMYVEVFPAPDYEYKFIIMPYDVPE